jgi:predicted Zn-dependent protease
VARVPPVVRQQFSGARAYVSKKKEDNNKPHPFEFILFISPSINAFA